MKHTPKNIVFHELIGLEVRVVESKVKSYVGIEGRVIDETRNTLVVRCRDGRDRTILKNVSIFEFKLPDGTRVRVKGSVLIGRPEERIKKKVRVW